MQNIFRTSLLFKILWLSGCFKPISANIFRCFMHLESTVFLHVSSAVVVDFRLLKIAFSNFHFNLVVVLLIILICNLINFFIAVILWLFYKRISLKLVDNTYSIAIVIHKIFYMCLMNIEEIICIVDLSFL